MTCFVAGIVLSHMAAAGNLDLELPGVEIAQPDMTKNYDINFGIQDEKYLVSPVLLNAYSSFAEAKLRAKAQAVWSHIKTHVDIGSTYAVNVPNYGTVYAPEIYVSYFQPHLEINLGRKFFNWSQLDSYWQLGLWQTEFKWNYLQPVEQGLTGAFVDIHTSDWKVLLFASPLFIPEQSAPFNLSNGQLNSQSPWFTPPAKYVQLFSGRADINYNLVIPDTSKIVNQFSAGMALQWIPKPFSVKISYVYKPRNTLALPVDGYLALQPNGSNAPVSVYPKVIYHHLVALDLNYHTKDFSAWVSGLAEFQTNQSFDSNLTYQVLSNQLLFSPGFEWVLFESQYSIKFGASGLFQSGGDVTEVGTLASPGTNIFAYPINYRDASQVRIVQPIIRASNQALDFDLKWVEELHDKSSLVMAELNYQYRMLNLFGGANLLGSSAEASNSGFIPRFRDNSMIYAGASLHY